MQSVQMNIKLALTSFSILGALSACASQSSTTRIVNEPSGSSVMYGSPKSITYVADVDVGREYGRITVYRNARCDVIPVTVMQSYQETLHGEEVVERTPVTKSQVAGTVEKQISCDQTYAQDVEVFLEAQGDRFSLGKTDSEGQVSANLATVFQVGSFEEVPQDAKVMVRPRSARPMVEVGSLSLAQLIKYNDRTSELLAQLSAVLAKGESGASSEEITRSYEIYAQLQDIASQDPRVQGISARFWELFVGRKKDESIERMGKTLHALSEAKETLKVMGDAAIPIYVQAAVSSGTLDRRALEWSSLRLIRALRGAPAVCRTGFAWSKVPSYGWPADARLASQYVRYGYGSGYNSAIQRSCARF